MTASTAAFAPSNDTGGQRYSAVAMTLHWLIAFSIFVQIGLGWYMGTLEGKAEKAIEVIHIPLGITILGLTLVRLAWRLVRRPPPLPAEMKAWERHLAEAVND